MDQNLMMGHIWINTEMPQNITCGGIGDLFGPKFSNHLKTLNVADYS